MRIKHTFLALFALALAQNVAAQTIDTSEAVSADLVAWETCTEAVKTFDADHASRLHISAPSIIGAEVKRADSIEILARNPYKFKVRNEISVQYVSDSKEVGTLGRGLYTIAEINNGVCKVSF